MTRNETSKLSISLVFTSLKFKTFKVELKVKEVKMIIFQLIAKSRIELTFRRGVELEK